MRKIMIVAVALGIAIIALDACKSNSDGEKVQPSKSTEAGESPSSEPRTAPGQAARDLVQTRDRLLEQMNANLADLDAKIASLKRDLASRSAERKSEAQEALADRIAELERKRAEARELLEQARTASEERWEQLKSKADDTLKDIHDAYEEVARELRE
jgi:TolA-binding protein